MLKDMKRPREKHDDMTAEPIVAGGGYPYGLRITLGGPELKKLGVSVKQLDINDKLSVAAIARVNSLSENRDDHRENQTVELTLEKMQIKKGTSKTKNYFKKLSEGPM